MTNSYEAKQEARRVRLEAAADRAEDRAEAAYKRADMSEAATGIPFGQPILVGHHSEARHRRAIDRASRAMDASVAESKRAGDLRAKAAAVGTGGISADDPEAIDKLKEQLAEKAATRESRETRWTGGIIITENTEENRLQIAFPGKPDAATRDALKSNGFRWAPSQDAWQRQLTNAAIYAGRRVIAALGLTPEEN